MFTFERDEISVIFKNENSVIVYSPPCHFKLVCISFVERKQQRITKNVGNQTVVVPFNFRCMDKNPIEVNGKPTCLSSFTHPDVIPNL